jgi:hypothetical protein
LPSNNYSGCNDAAFPQKSSVFAGIGHGVVHAAGRLAALRLQMSEWASQAGLLRHRLLDFVLLLQWAMLWQR